MKPLKVRKVMGYWTIWQYSPRHEMCVGPDYVLKAWFDSWQSAVKSLDAHLRYKVGY